HPQRRPPAPPSPAPPDRRASRPVAGQPARDAVIELAEHRRALPVAILLAGAGPRRLPRRHPLAPGPPPPQRRTHPPADPVPAARLGLPARPTAHPSRPPPRAPAADPARVKPAAVQALAVAHPPCLLRVPPPTQAF